MFEGSHVASKKKEVLFCVCIGNEVMISGQIIATSHDLTPNGGLVREIPRSPVASPHPPVVCISDVREIPLFQGNLAW